MKKLTLEEIKQYQLDILDAFDAFCKENDLEYQLAYGTLLGAVRHQGFIPWDDDIDLMMPNDDYYRLIDILNTRKNGGMLTDRYRLADISIESDIPYHQGFGKIYDTKTTVASSSLKGDLGTKEGVFVDIFRIDGIPQNPTKYQKMLKKANFFNEMAYYSSRKPTRSDFSFRNPKQLLQTASFYRKARKHPTSYWLKNFDAVLRSCPSCKKAARAYDIKGSLMDGGLYDFEDNPWFPTVLLPFEGKEYPAPAQYEKILRRYYGNYWELPPEDKRKPSHDQGFYLLD